MVDVSTVSIVIASTSVVLAAIYYVLSLRHQTKLRQTDLVMRLYSILGSMEFWEALTKVMMMEFENYDEYRKKYAPSPAGFSEKPEVIALGPVGIFFNGVGVLLHMKLIDINLATRLFGTSTIYTWEKMKPIIEGFRRDGYPQLFSEFEYLYDEMKKREQRQAKIR